MLLNRKKVLNLLGLANRAGKLVSGEDSVLRLLKQNELKLVFIASDASAKQIDKFSKKCFFYKTKLDNTFNCEELSSAIGKPMRKIIGITDEGFLKALNEYLNGGAINEG